MASHYSIIIKKFPVKTQSALKSDIALGQLMTKIEREGGPLKAFRGKAYEAAELLSRNKIVESVTVIQVSETSCGVWRKGVKS